MNAFNTSGVRWARVSSHHLFMSLAITKLFLNKFKFWNLPFLVEPFSFHFSIGFYHLNQDNGDLYKPIYFHGKLFPSQQTVELNVIRLVWCDAGNDFRWNLAGECEGGRSCMENQRKFCSFSEKAPDQTTNETNDNTNIKWYETIFMSISGAPKHFPVNFAIFYYDTYVFWCSRYQVLCHRVETRGGCILTTK